VRPQVYETEVGEISTVALSDGSLMQLNTDSQVEVRYSSAERNIRLLRGEAFFDVAKNASKPFVVESGSDRVTAIGTAFGVDATKDTAIEIVVTEGRVKVNRHLDAKTPKYEDVYLTPGQKLVVRDDKTEVENDLDTESLLAWREGMVIFQGESLREVVAEIDRYTPLKFRLMDAEIASISVGGFFKTGDLDQLLMVLEQNFGVASQRQGDEIILLKANL
jgi:transmembrane sensor